MPIDSSLSATHFATRFLLPFRFDPQRWESVQAALRETNWKSHPPHELYRADYTHDFIQTTFGTDGNGRWFQWDRQPAQKKPGDEIEISYLRTPAKAITQAKLVHCDGRDIELFVDPRGCGVLSVSLKPASQDAPLSLAAIKTLNYSLCQDGSSRNAARIRKATGQGYGDYVLKDLCLELLSCFTPDNTGFRLLHPQAPLMPYTVVRFGQHLAFSSITRPTGVPPEDDLAAQASLLAQVDEAAHPLPTAEDHGAVVRAYHTDELAAASCMGAAFFVSDTGTQFDSLKFYSRLDKYFLGFLAALMQKMRLRALAEEAAIVAKLQPGPERIGRLEALRNSMLENLAAGDLIEISVRDAVNRFLLQCQQALRVPESLGLVKSAIADLDSSLQASRQSDSLGELGKTQSALHELGEKQGEVMERLASTQNKVEWIEIFVISFYSGELVEMLGKEFDIAHDVRQVALLAAVIGSALIAGFMLRPWDESIKKKASVNSPTRFLTVVAIVTLLILAYVGIGRLVHHQPTHDPSAVALQELRTEAQEIRKQLSEVSAKLAQKASSERKEPDQESAKQANEKPIQKPDSH